MIGTILWGILITYLVIGAVVVFWPILWRVTIAGTIALVIFGINPFAQFL